MKARLVGDFSFPQSWKDHPEAEGVHAYAASVRRYALNLAEASRNMLLYMCFGRRPVDPMTCGVHTYAPSTFL